MRLEKLNEIGAKEGDLIEIIKKGERYKGMLMPHHSFSGKDIVTIKMENGYNIGINVAKAEIRLIKKVREIKNMKNIKKIKTKKEIPLDPSKETISIMGTGGTIASYVDYRTGGVHPATSPQELAFSFPEIFSYCNVKARVIFQKFSENIHPKDWQILAREVAEELNDVGGVVISHGTDTMGYTSAALSFMLKKLNGPVVLVGAQRSSDRPSSDAAKNLLAGIKVALSDIGEVVVVMHGSSSSFEPCEILRGTKVRKMHSSRRDAFQSINVNPIGIVDEEVIFKEKYRKKGEETVIDTKINEKVALLYSYPGLDGEAIERMCDGKDGLVIAGTGLGHIPQKCISTIKKLIDGGMHVVMTTQCFWGRVNMNVYSTGRDLIKAGVIPGEDMLPETAYVKLMWVLGHTSDKNDVSLLMKKNLAGEIEERRSMIKD